MTAADSTVAASVVEARRPGIAKFSAATAVTAVDSTVAESVAEARPPGVAKYNATTKSELAESSGERPVVAKSVENARKGPLPRVDKEVVPNLAWMPLHGTSCCKNIAGRGVGYRTVAELGEKSGQ